MTDRSLETLDCVRFTFRERLDAAVRQISHPAVQSFALSHRVGEESEPDALHATAHEVPSGSPHWKTAYDSMQSLDEESPPACLKNPRSRHSNASCSASRFRRIWRITNVCRA